MKGDQKLTHKGLSLEEIDVSAHVLRASELDDFRAVFEGFLDSRIKYISQIFEQQCVDFLLALRVNLRLVRDPR